MSEDRSLLDRPIRGDLHRATRHRVEQGTPREFMDSLDALLAADGVEAVTWDQYTPYFNDGDPCEFSTHEVYVRIEGVEESGDYGDGRLGTYELEEYIDPSLPGRERYDDANKRGITLNGYDTDEARLALKSFSREIARHQDLLLEKFGDHAQVTATAEGFDVEFYQHE